MIFLKCIYHFRLCFKCNTLLKFSEMIKIISLFFLQEDMVAFSICMHFVGKDDFMG
jgi:hypothetical protein